MNPRLRLRITEGLLDTVLITAMMILFALGCYFTCDSVHVFRNSTFSSVGRYLKDEQEIADEMTVLSRDAVGWLILDDTGISYPVMQGENNTDYLNTDPYGRFSLAGSIFLDCRNSRDFSDQYSLLYGHHMANDAMFGALDHYYDEDYFRLHRQGILYAGDRKYELMVFALISCDANNSLIFDPGSKGKLIEFARKKALIFLEPEEGRVIGMSTCRDQGTLKRTVLLASLKEINENENA